MAESPMGLFEFTTPDGTGGVINLDLVAVARWDGNKVRGLHVYFAQGPHVRLEEDQGKKFLEALRARSDNRTW